MITYPEAQDFQSESNRIEGLPSATEAETVALMRFLGVKRLQISDLVDYVNVIAPNSRVRDEKSIPTVRIGNYVSMASGPWIREELKSIVQQANSVLLSPHAIHVHYQFILPFTDGNGQSGRALWLWMRGEAPRSFLLQFYRDILSQHRRRHNDRN